MFCDPGLRQTADCDLAMLLDLLRSWWWAASEGLTLAQAGRLSRLSGRLSAAEPAEPVEPAELAVSDRLNRRTAGVTGADATQAGAPHSALSRRRA